MENKFRYSDSLAGNQTIAFDKLSELIKHIEDFGHTGEETSYGTILQNEEPIFEYISNSNMFRWKATDKA